MGTTNLTSDAWIKNTTVTITSDAVISFRGVAAEFDEACEEIFNEEVFQKAMTYRRIHRDEDNMTGDADIDDYTEYDILGELQLQERSDKLVKVGELNVGDAEVFLPARITHTSNGNMLPDSFRPQVGDRIFRKNKWYRIKTVQFERINNREIYVACWCTQMENKNPPVGWNTNYDKYEDNVGGGGWS